MKTPSLDVPPAGPLPRPNREILGPLAFFIGEYRREFALVLAAAVAAAAVESLVAAALYPLVTVVLGGALAGGGPLLEMLAQVVEAAPSETRLFVAVALFMGLVIASTGAQLGREWLSAHMATLVTYRVKQRMFRRLVDAPYLYLLSLAPGDLTYRLTVAPPFLALNLLVMATIVSLSLVAFFILVLLFSVDWRSTLAILAFGVTFFAASRYLALSFIVRAGRKRFNAGNAEIGIVTEFASGYREIAIARGGAAWSQRFSTQGDIMRRQLVRDFVASVTPGHLLQLGVLLAVAVAAVLLRALAPDALLSALPVAAVYAYAVRQLLGVLSQLSRNWLQLGGHAPEVRLLHRSLVEAYPSQRAGALTAPLSWKAISFADVSFTYPARTEPAVADVSFTIARGEMTALVGPSGSGKTTLANLLARLLEATSGRIVVDDLDILDIERDDWLRHIGYVGQDGFVYDATVLENIAFGRDVERDAVERAAKAAYASEFIERLPGGYDTRLGERGLSLSAGQRQRLLIARALALDPELLILDEATAALDSRSELMVHEALSALRHRCTIVVVAHRLSSIRAADRIVVIEQGRVSEQGSHEALMTRSGTYAQLARMQHQALTST